MISIFFLQINSLTKEATIFYITESVIIAKTTKFQHAKYYLKAISKRWGKCHRIILEPDMQIYSAIPVVFTFLRYEWFKFMVTEKWRQS